jgi:hypothetical protein
MKTGACQHASDPSRSHLRAKHLQPTHQVADKIRKPVHRFTDLDERVGAFVVKALRPGGDRQRCDEEPPSGLCLRPASCGSQFENRESFSRRVVRPTLRRDAFHSRILDSELFTQERDLAVPLVELDLLRDLAIGIVGRSSTRGSEDNACHRDGVDDGRADVTGPTPGQENALSSLRAMHERPPREFALEPPSEALLPAEDGRKCALHRSAIVVAERSELADDQIAVDRREDRFDD